MFNLHYFYNPSAEYSFVPYSEKGASMVATLGKNAKFSQFDINDDKSLESALTGALVLQKLMKTCIVSTTW